MFLSENSTELDNQFDVNEQLLTAQKIHQNTKETDLIKQEIKQAKTLDEIHVLERKLRFA